MKTTKKGKHACTVGRKDGRTDERTDGRTDERTDGFEYISIPDLFFDGEVVDFFDLRKANV